MLALCLNLDDAVDRWEFTRDNFEKQNIELQRVSAVVGRNIQFPIPEFDSKAYQRWHGKRPIPAEVGCYLSHLKAMKLFLESEETHALICEDDLTPADKLEEIIYSAMRFQDHWDILRLSGFHDPKPKAIARLKHDYSLCMNMKFLAGTGAYLVNRQAASVLRERLLPMFLPYDHALDREWLWGLKSLCIHPLPIDQSYTEFATQIVTRKSKIPWYKRYWTVAPYRLKMQMERLFFRSIQLRKHEARIAKIERSTSYCYRTDSRSACLTMNKA